MGKILASHESLERSNANNRFKTSQKSISMRQSTNSQSRPTNQPIRPRYPSKQIVVDDKAKKSERKKQERAMQEIVFDDTNTPQFCHRADLTEDKTLEEAAKKPMTAPSDITEEQVPNRAKVAGAAGDQLPSAQRNKYDSVHEAMEDRLSPPT